MSSKRPLTFIDQYPYPKKGRIEGDFILPSRSGLPAARLPSLDHHVSDEKDMYKRTQRDEAWYNMRPAIRGLFDKRHRPMVHPTNEMPSRFGFGYYDWRSNKSDKLDFNVSKHSAVRMDRDIRAIIGSYLGEGEPGVTFKKGKNKVAYDQSPDDLLDEIFRKKFIGRELPLYYYDPQDYYTIEGDS